MEHVLLAPGPFSAVSVWNPPFVTPSISDVTVVPVFLPPHFS